MWQIIILSVIMSVNGRYAPVTRKLDWWERSTFYQIYVRSFMDSDGDGVGDINGVTSRLEYFKELAIDAIILSPIFKSPMYDFGFDVSDYYAIHSEYGTMEDFEELLRKSTLLNIKVVLDFVPNHTSNESEWFMKSANKDEYYSDWYIWENGHVSHDGTRRPPNNWISMFRKSAWTYMPSRDQYYLHQFASSEPDLNYRNPVVLDEIKTIIKFWLEKGVAGLRMSSINHVFEIEKENYGGRYPDEPKSGKRGVNPEDYEYLDHVYTKDLDDTYELVFQFREVFDGISVRDNLTRVMMTETSYSNIKNAVRYYGEGIRSGAHMPLNSALLDCITSKDVDARDVKFVIDRWLTYKPLKKRPNWITGNQDKNRVASRFRSELVDAFNMLLLLLPGVAVTYMGEEIGMENGFVPWTQTKDSLACNTDDPVNFIEVSRDPVRTPFHWSNTRSAGFTAGDKTWLPVATGYEHNNVASQRSAVRSHYQVYRTLTNLRLRPAFRYGRFDSLAMNSDVFAFKRWFNDDTYLVVINFGRSYQAVNLTAFDLVFGLLEVEASNILSSRTFSDNLQASYIDLAENEALVLRMQV